MKSILFLFFMGIRSCKKYTPDENPEKAARKELFLVFGVFFAAVIYKFLHELGLWPWLMDNWPYEYGRAHSKNLIAPTGILAIIVASSLWFSIKKYFNRENILEYINSVFDNELGREKAAKYDSAPIILMFFNIFAGAMFAGGYWIMFGLCFVVWFLIEMWVRKTFY